MIFHVVMLVLALNLVRQKCKYDSRDLIECNGNLQNICRCKSPHGSRRFEDICETEFISFEIFTEIQFLFCNIKVVSLQ